MWATWDDDMCIFLISHQCYSIIRGSCERFKLSLKPSIISSWSLYHFSSHAFKSVQHWQSQNVKTLFRYEISRFYRDNLTDFIFILLSPHRRGYGHQEVCIYILFNCIVSRPETVLLLIIFISGWYLIRMTMVEERFHLAEGWICHNFDLLISFSLFIV